MSTSLNLRHIANLILPWSMWMASSITPLLGGRSPADMSDGFDTPLVPFGAAFSIWLPIFVGTIIYGVVQFLPKNRDRVAFKSVGLYTALGFAGVTAWGLITAYAPLQMTLWLSALTFVPTTILLCIAAVKLSEFRLSFTGWQRWAIYVPLMWMAGWCSIAVFLNWAQIGMHKGLGFGMPATVICVLALAAALGWVSLIYSKIGGGFAYLFPVLWGLGFLLIDRVFVHDFNLSIIIAACIGIVVLLGSYAYTRFVKPQGQPVLS